MAQGNARQRSCIACGLLESKGKLQRVVRSADGRVSFDASGRAAGRGAYVCSTECFQAARKTNKLSRALKCNVTDDDYEAIEAGLRQELNQA